MTTKRKLWTSIGALALVMIVAATSVGITIAALQAKVSSGFSISYTAKNVSARIKGTYITKDGEDEQSLGDDLIFNGDEEQDTTKSFDETKKPNVTINNPNTDYLEMHFTIENTGENGFGVTLTLTGLEDSNFNVKYSSSYRTSSEAASFNCTKANVKNNLYVTAKGSDSEILDIGVKISIKDNNLTSSANGNFNFVLDGLKEEPKYSTLFPGGILFLAWRKAQSITFGNLTGENEFLVNGENKIANYSSVNSVSADEHTKCYTVKNETGEDAYILAEKGYIISLNENCSGMFMNSPAQTIVGLDLIDTSKVTNINCMFCGCSNLQSISGIENWDVSHVTQIFGSASGYNGSPFTGCTALENLDLSGWDISGITTTLGYESSDSSSSKYLGIFSGLTSLKTLDISGWDTSNVTSMIYMFGGCINLKTVYVGDGWDTSNVKFGLYMFYNCRSLVGQDGTKCAGGGRDTDLDYARVDNLPDEPGYFTYKAA